MLNAYDVLKNLIVITGSVFVLIMAYIYLKPLKFHVKRKWSTLMLKLSYMLYLIAMLVVLYFALVGYKNSQEGFNEMQFIAILICLFLPNTAILSRRRVERWRTLFNYIFTGVHLLMTGYLVWLTFHVMV